MSMQTLAERLRPLTDVLATVAIDAVDAAATLRKKAPVDGELVRGLAELLFEGARDGWLLPKENGGVRFGRVAKDLGGFSVDAVWMDGPGPRHRHPGGEIDLCLVAEGEPKFDGHAPGWVVYGPDSTHVPTVSGGAMLILYFLPGGAIEFL
jgi:hypothetical protein